MRAFVVMEPNVFGWVDVADPAVGPDEVVVRARYTGLCGTDLHIVEGIHPRARFPLALGHEIVGVPEAGPLAGQLVLVDPLLPCFACSACSSGASNACADLRLIGIDRHGALAGRLAVSSRRLHAVPAGLPEELAPLAEPLAVAVHAVRRAPALLGRLVVVVGGGPVGLLVAHCAQKAGASVLLAEPAPGRRSVATRLGYGLLDATNPIGELEAKTARRLADVVFDAAASPAVAASLCGLVAPTGYVAIIGTYGEPAAVDLQAVMFKELRIVGSRTYLPSDLDAALVLLARDQDQLRPILSGVVAPDALGETFEALRAGEGLKYVVECPT